MLINIAILVLAGITQLLPTDDNKKIKLIGVTRNVALFILIGISILFGIIKEISDSHNEDLQKSQIINLNKEIDSLNYIITGIRSTQQLQINTANEQFNINLQKFDSLNNNLSITSNNLEFVLLKQRENLEHINVIENLKKASDYSIKDSHFEFSIKIPIKSAPLKTAFSNLMDNKVKYTQIQLDSIFEKSLKTTIKDILEIRLNLHICNLNDSLKFPKKSFLIYTKGSPEYKYEKYYSFKDNNLILNINVSKPYVYGTKMPNFNYFNLLENRLITELSYEMKKSGIFNIPEVSYINWKIGKETPIKLHIPFEEPFCSLTENVTNCIGGPCPEIIAYQILFKKENVDLFQWAFIFYE